MSLTQALATAVTGMRVTQAGLSIVAANVANAETPGWVRKTTFQIPIAAGSAGAGVRIASINRELDQYIQRQMRVESSARPMPACARNFRPAAVDLRPAGRRQHA